jgi:hypothetical protein
MNDVGMRGVVRLSLVLACLGLCLACEPGLDTYTVVDPSARFGEYKTFSFGAFEGPPTGYKASPTTSEIERRVKKQVEQELAQSGYTRVAERGELVLLVGAGWRDAWAIDTGEDTNAWLPQDERGDSVEGVIVVDAYDARVRRRVWHGTHVDARDRGRIDTSELTRTVSELMSDFPSVYRVLGRARPRRVVLGED